MLMPCRLNTEFEDKRQSHAGTHAHAHTHTHTHAHTRTHTLISII